MSAYSRSLGSDRCCVPGPPGPQGLRGPGGPIGPAGVTGSTGAPGASGSLLVGIVLQSADNFLPGSTGSFTLQSDFTNYITAGCIIAISDTSSQTAYYLITPMLPPLCWRK